MLFWRCQRGISYRGSTFFSQILLLIQRLDMILVIVWGITEIWIWVFNYSIKHVENTKIAFHQSALKLKTMSDSCNFQGSDVGKVLGRVPAYKFIYLFNNH